MKNLKYWKDILVSATTASAVHQTVITGCADLGYTFNTSLGYGANSIIAEGNLRYDAAELLRAAIQKEDSNESL